MGLCFNLRFSLALTLSILVNINPALANITFSDSFEGVNVGSPPNNNPWGSCSGNCPLVSNEHARSGKQSLHAYLNRNTSKNPYRTEVVVRPVGSLPMGTEAWYGISIFLPKDHPGLPGPLLQFANTKELDIGESHANNGTVPVHLKFTEDGKWHLFDQSITDRVTTKYSERKRTTWSFPAEKGKWTDFVFHVKWSWKEDGLFQVWKNGKMVADKKGPNAYNDPLAPKLKFGEYNREWDPNYIKKYDGPKNPEIVDVSVFFDDISVATGPNVRYEDVAPGKGKAAPDQISKNPPAQPKGLKIK